jgi:hypothetical protein
MAKLQLDDDVFNMDELDEAEVSEDYVKYDGPVAPKNTILAGHLKKVWTSRSTAGNLMLVNLFIAEGNAGDKAKFNGMPLFDRVTFTPKARFHWDPYLAAFGITLKDIQKKIDIGDEEENNGNPVNKIAKFKPGEDAACRVLASRSKYEGEIRNEVSKWLPADEADEPDDDDDSDDKDF